MSEVFPLTVPCGSAPACKRIGITSFGKVKGPDLMAATSGLRALAFVVEVKKISARIK